MPISMNSPSASIVATPAGADCSSSASCSTRSLRHPLDIGLHALALKHKTTTCSGHCTQAATPLKEKAKTNQPMNNVIQFEDRVSRSRSKHEGESSAEVCDRLSRTRVSSQRQLPTDHDYAVPTREYQLDQSSPLPATAAADLVLEVRRQKPIYRFGDIDRSLHINFRLGG